jgi:integrase
MARDKVRRNVVLLCEIPEGKAGRPSKSLTLEQAKALLTAAESTRMRAYIVVSLLTGARTEELRALTWANVDLDGDPDIEPPRPPSIRVWHSVRESGETKTRKSRRTLALPGRCVDALVDHQDRSAYPPPQTLVFTTKTGTAMDRHNVLRDFRTVVQAAGLDAESWTPRELRHSFVSLLSDSGVRIEDIADLCGHAGTSVTESVYRHQLRPVLLEGAVAMDKIFGPPPSTDG